MSTESELKEARRKKIKQLEASLFGNDSSVITGLPELQRVDEYASKRGQAERKKTALPSLKKQVKKEVKNIFFPDPRKKPFQRLKSPGYSGSDEEDLLESSNSTSSGLQDDSSSNTTPGVLPSPMATPPVDPNGRRSANILRSEVEQLDESIKQLVIDPKQEVLDKIKKRHGILGRSTSADTNLDKVPAFGSVTDVREKGDVNYLSQATILQQKDKVTTSRLGSSGRMRSTPTLDKSDKILADEQKHLDQQQIFQTNAISNTSLDDTLAANWPSMPEIKAKLAIKGGKKDSLQPLAMKSKEKKKKRSKPKRLSMPSFTDAIGLTPKTIGFTPIDNITPGKGSKLPAIEKGLDVPSIQVDSAIRRRRDPKTERKASLPLKKEEEASGEMISFEGLERPYSAGPNDTFENVPTSMEDIPNAFEDIPNGTFDGIPKDVFDAIPTAVSEREVRRLERKQRPLEDEKLIDHPDQALKPEKSQAAELIFMLERQSGDSQEVLKPEVAPEVSGTVSLITALFPHARNTTNEPDQVHNDFMFALFIHEQDQAAPNGPNEGSMARPPPVPKPDPNDPEVGHFCAPFCPGFCEANFCIFHTSDGKMKNEEEAT